MQDAISQNICLASHKALKTHGFFMNPDTFTCQNRLIPIFSPAKLDGCFADIMIPLMHAHSLKPASPVSWKEKLNILFWRGSSTSGSMRVGTRWREYHRIRLLDWEQKFKLKHPDQVFDAGKVDNWFGFI
jgi:hypothetical protein